MAGKPSKAAPSDELPSPKEVHVKFDRKKGIVIGGRVLQPDQDPLDLMERYFEEGEPDA